MKIGSLFSGYGGLDMAVQAVFPNAHPAWFVEYDQAPASILKHHWTEVPNYGDVTEIDWKEMGRNPDIATTERMYDLYCQGNSLAKVAEIEGVSRQTVYTRFKRLGLDMRPRPKPLPVIIFEGGKYSIGVNGYYRLTSGSRSYLHRDVWTHHFGSIPDGSDIHHIDHDKTNNDISNLECLSKSEHTRLHKAKNGGSGSPQIDILTAGYP